LTTQKKFFAGVKRYAAVVPHYLNNYGIVLALTAEFGLAAEKFEGALKDPLWKAQSTWINLAKTYLALKEFSKVDDLLERFADNFGSTPALLMLGGDLALARGKFDAAQARFESLRKVDPNNSAWPMRLGLVAQRRQRHSEAIVLLETATTLNQNDRDAFKYLAINFLKLGSKKQARRHLEKLILLEKKVLNLNFHLVDMVHNRANLMALSKESSASNLARALAFTKLDQYARALQLVDK